MFVLSIATFTFTFTLRVTAFSTSADCLAILFYSCSSIKQPLANQPPSLSFTRPVTRVPPHIQWKLSCQRHPLDTKKVSVRELATYENVN